MDIYTSFELAEKLAKHGCNLGKGEVSVKVGKKFMYKRYDILNEICVKYAKEFFGELKFLKTGWGANDSTFQTIQILKLVQQGKKQEAENYIWKHCLFNNKNNG